MSSTSTVLTVTTVSVIAGLTAYALYFDYNRRNNVEFRKKLRKEQKRVDRSTANLKAAAAKAGMPSEAELQEVLEKLKAEPTPARGSMQAQEYFGDQISKAEAFAIKEQNLECATCLYRAMRVYAEPMSLLQLVQQMFPPQIFLLLTELMTMDVSKPASATSPPKAPSSKGSRRSNKSKTGSSKGGDGDLSSPPNSGPPSEASVSSQEWDQVTDSLASSAAAL